MLDKKSFLEDSQCLAELVSELQKMGEYHKDTLLKIFPCQKSNEVLDYFCAQLSLDLIDVTSLVATSDGRFSKSEIRGLKEFLKGLVGDHNDSPISQMLIEEYLQLKISTFLEHGPSHPKIRFRLTREEIGEASQVLAKSYVNFAIYVSLLDNQFHSSESKTIRSLMDSLRPLLSDEFYREKSDQIKSLSIMESKKHMDSFTNELRAMLG